MTETSRTPPRPDGAVPLALALLERTWPAAPQLADAVGAATIGSDAVTALEANPRYLIGRFQQALTALLATDLPSMDPPTGLLSHALADAIAWRQHQDRPCPRCADSLRDPCNADWDQADRYHALARALGAVGNPPPPRPRRSPRRSSLARAFPRKRVRPELTHPSLASHPACMTQTVASLSYAPLARRVRRS